MKSYALEMAFIVGDVWVISLPSEHHDSNGAFPMQLLLSQSEKPSRLFVPAIASLIAKLNMIEMPLPKYPQYIPLVHSWLQKYRSNGGDSLNLVKTAVAADVSFPDVLTVDELEKEIEEIERFLNLQKSPSVFCHQDTVSSNILLRDVVDEVFDGNGVVDAKRLLIIDFEFGCYNHRAFEIANHIAEYGVTYGTLNPPYYEVDVETMEDENLAISFCNAYLDQIYRDHVTAAQLERQLLTGRRKEDLKLLMCEYRRFLPLPHFFWGVWNILCNQELGMVEGIDFLTHAKDRLIMYYMFKSNMYKY
uniref:Choline/ethanolamine kinase n=1 Tax=Angiostrongylus cantonensis TaxID=6313 RepID=A0A0K0CUY6_ANGCA